jgi:hypothetical protein
MGTGRSFPDNSHSSSAKVVGRKALSLISNPLICFYCFLLGKKTVLALYYQSASKTKKMCENTPCEWVTRPQIKFMNSLRVFTTHPRDLVVKDQKSWERKQHWRYVNNCSINYSGRQRLPQLPIWSFCIDLTRHCLAEPGDAPHSTLGISFPYKAFPRDTLISLNPACYLMARIVWICALHLIGVYRL